LSRPDFPRHHHPGQFPARRGGFSRRVARFFKVLQSQPPHCSIGSRKSIFRKTVFLVKNRMSTTQSLSPRIVIGK
jgi:hypothetical protein